MATKLDYGKIPIASPRNNTRHDLSHRHLTTSSFCEVQPTLIQELIPNSHVEFSLSPFLRMLPLPSPSFTSIKVSNRQFFVPFRTIFPNWNQFITDTPHAFSNTRIPTIRDYDFAYFILMTTVTSGSSKLKYLIQTTANDYDIVVPTKTALNADSNGDKYYRFTPAGARVVKTLNSLGYIFGFHYEGAAGKPSQTIEYSFLPFLAYLKVYIDYYHPAQYLNNVNVQQIQDFIDNLQQQGDNSPSVWLNSNGSAIFDELRTATLDSDYFTSAWQQPTSPNAGEYSAITLQIAQPQHTIGTSATSIITAGNAEVNGIAKGTPLINITPDGVGTSQLTDYGLRTLKKLTDYMARNQFVGSREIDRYLARYGVRLDFSKFNRSQYVDHQEFTLNIGDVTSTADTAEASLGSYAGKGIGFAEGERITFDTDEFGYFINICTIMPRLVYFQQYARQNRHINRFDFWTPEFDGLGTQVIPNSEIFSGNYIGPRLYEMPAGDVNTIFGWQPRYSEYKMSRDIATGQFITRSLTDFSSWVCKRDVTQIITDTQGGQSTYVDGPIDETFVKSDDYAQYNNIFYATDDDDKFLCANDFQFIVNSPMKSLYDIHEYNDEHQGEERDLPIGGTTLN